jgi:hypothetical protein
VKVYVKPGVGNACTVINNSVKILPPLITSNLRSKVGSQLVTTWELVVRNVMPIKVNA